MKRSGMAALVALALGVAAGAVFAQAKPETLVKQRQAVMTLQGKYFGPMAAMAQGKAPYNADIVRRNAAYLDNLSRMPWDGFDPGTKDVKSAALAGLFFLLWTALALAQGDAKRGEYLSKAGGCLGCHTEERKDAVPYAGGRALKTPFGTFYGPNITPHLQAGIGRWSFADFVRALREGERPDGAHYFPAFPYPSFTRIRNADLRDLWAYLRTLKPSPQPSKPHDLGILYRWR